jgi:hypothetical protein
VIKREALERIAQQRLADAKALLKARRYRGGVYLCGYAVELALKVRICRTLDWKGFPETGSEFKNYLSLKIHDLDVLLSLTGFERQIKARHLAAWSIVTLWKPESRYKPAQTTRKADLVQMIAETETLMRALL